MTEKVFMAVIVLAVIIWGFFALVGAIHISGGC